MKVSIIPGLSNLQGPGIWQFTRSLFILTGCGLRININDEPKLIQKIAHK